VKRREIFFNAIYLIIYLFIYLLTKSWLPKPKPWSYSWSSRPRISARTEEHCQRNLSFRQTLHHL